MDDEANGKGAGSARCRKRVSTSQVPDDRRVTLQEVRFAVEDATRGQISIIVSRLRQPAHHDACQHQKIVLLATVRVRARLTKK